MESISGTNEITALVVPKQIHRLRVQKIHPIHPGLFLPIPDFSLTGQKCFSGIPFTNFHCFVAVVSVGNYYRATVVLFIALPRPADTIGMVEIISLWSIGKIPPCFHEQFNVFNRRHPDVIFIAVFAMVFVIGTKKVRIKHAGISLIAQ